MNTIVQQIEQHYRLNTDRLRIRDEPLSGAFVAPVRGKLTKYAYRVLGNWEDAEDAVQSCYEKALRYREAFKKGGELDSWIFIILANTISTVRSRKSQEPDMEEADDTIGVDEYLIQCETPEDSLELIKWNAVLQRVCFGLSVRDVGILQLYFLYGHTMPGIAELLDLNIHTVKRVVNTHSSKIRGE